MSDYAEPLQQVDRTYVRWHGRKLSYFAGCDYLRLSSHPAVHEAIRDALEKFGLSVSASRKTTGNHSLYEELESATRTFFDARSAVVSSTGYFTNVIAAQGLRGEIDHVLIDERAHGSLRDAASFLGCPVTEFAHLDPRSVKKKIPARVRRSRLALLTDGMFSHDGSIAPLAQYREIIGADALLWVDDAHAGGIIGENGRGTVELAALPRKKVLQTVTFSKAFGTYGGAVLCDKNVAAQITKKSAAVGGNTPIPLPLAAATIRSLELCDAALRARLFENIRLFWRGVGLNAPEHPAPIIFVSVKNPATLRAKLLAAGIYPPLIKYPGGPAGGYFRIALSSEHTPAQIRKLAQTL